MGMTDSTTEPAEGSNISNPVAAHELVFGRESTAGYLQEQAAQTDGATDACDERVTSATSPSKPLEQRKPPGSLRV